MESIGIINIALEQLESNWLNSNRGLCRHNVDTETVTMMATVFQSDQTAPFLEGVGVFNTGIFFGTKLCNIFILH